MSENIAMSNKQAANQPLTAHLSARITKQASKQTYYTVKYLVDRDRVADAYRAYAYFRWVDDQLDQENVADFDRVAFLERQKSLVNCSLWGVQPCAQTEEEQILVDLMRGEHETNSGLLAYVRHMMAVMTFDAHRRGRFITQFELTEYERLLATAVTEALHTFIGHSQYAPQDETRYLAATAAHITHMLRDTFEDVAAGYYNVPHELLSAHNLGPGDVEHEVYRNWVRERVSLARSYFESGRGYLLQVENGRCRLAGYAYIARFEGVLKTIEQDGYVLKPEYASSKKLAAATQSGWSTISSVYQRHRHSSTDQFQNRSSADFADYADF